MASKAGKTSGKRGARRSKDGSWSVAQDEGIWERLPGRTRHIAVVCVLIFVSAVFFAPATFGGRKLVGSDTVQSRAMAKSLVDYRERTGEYALWATNLFSGMPGYMISYPKAVVQVDSIVSWAGRHIWPTVHFMLFLGGVYVLVFLLTTNRLAALIAALAAGLTTYVPIILSVGHSTKFAAIAWVPWLLAAFRYALKRPGWIAAGLFAILLAAELRAGHPQISYHAAWLIAIWWIVDGVGSAREGRLRQFATATAVLAFGVVLALVLVAQPYMVQFEYKQFSTRGGSAAVAESAGLSWDYAMSWSQGKLELLTLFVADLFGGGSGLYWGDKPPTEGPHYLGGIVLLLALIAVAGRRERVVWGLALGALILTLFALGKNAAWINRPLFDYFPLFSAFRAPEMWLHMVELSLAILAGLGAAYVVDKRADGRRKKTVLTTAGCLLGVSLILTLGGESMLSFQRPGEDAQAAMQLAARENVSPADPGVQREVRQYMMRVREERVEAFKADAVRTTVFLVIASVLLWLYFRGKARGWALLATLAALVLFDLWGVGKRHLSSDDFTDGSIDSKVAMYRFDQFIIDKVAEAGGPGHFRALSLEASPTNWARPAFHYETSGGYNAAKLQVYQELIDNVLFDPATGLPTEIGLDLTATRYVVFNRPLPGARGVYSDPTGMSVWERAERRPRNHFVGRFLLAETDEETYARLNDPAYDPIVEAVVRTEPGLEPAPIDSTSTTSVSLMAYGPREIKWDVETDRARLFVTSEVYYPAGWRAFVDDAEVPIIRTNHAFRSVAVSPGRHTVKMTFNPERHFTSVWITTVAALLVYGALAVLLGFAWVRRRQKRGE